MTGKLLFVYGTLMSTATSAYGRDMRARLHGEARVVGAACLPGRLYDLGQYPGAVVGGAADGLVHGELLELAAPEATFPWLDAYEGIRGAADDEYRRALQLVRPAEGGAEVEAWVYVLLSPPEGLPLIAGGRWRAGA